MRRVLGAVVAVTLLLAGCGGGEDEPTDEASAEPTAEETGDDGPYDGRTEPCPTREQQLEDANAATYAVVAEIDLGGGQVDHVTFGTAWAADRRLLVTNGHVADVFTSFAEQGVPLSRALAVQAGTGSVLELLSKTTHPDWTGDPLRSPDVALLTTKEAVPSSLVVARGAQLDVALGDEISIVGFPGDVNTFIAIAPGETVPQATSLIGAVTALRTFDDASAVDEDNVDVLQHQAPTTPGTSGSSMVRCGVVVGINNAGTVRQVVTPTADGSFQVERQAQAANNFGIAARHVQDLLDLWRDRAVVGVELPIPAAAPPQDQGSGATAGALAGRYEARITQDLVNSIVFDVAADGSITGTSTWQETGEFSLVGQVAADGSFRITDDAPERRDFRRGVYEGRIAGDGSVVAVYFEETREDQTFPVSGSRMG